MKNKCSIVKDLLPLYAEDMVSEDTKNFIDEHLESCDSCKKELETMKKVEVKQDISSAKPIKSLANKLLLKRLLTILLTALITVAIIIVTYTGLTTPIYFDYSEDLITITEDESGHLTATFAEYVTEFNFNSVYDPSTDQTLMFVTAWNTAWDKITSGKPQIACSFQITDKVDLIFYSPNNGEYDVLIYGNTPQDFGGIQSLPRLVLGYYFIIAIALFIILVVFGAILEKNFGKTKLVYIINFIIPLPASYAIAHICTMVSGWTAYSHMRYLIANLGLTVIISCIYRLIFKLIQLKKESKQIQ